MCINIFEEKRDVRRGEGRARLDDDEASFLQLGDNLPPFFLCVERDGYCSLVMSSPVSIYKVVVPHSGQLVTTLQLPFEKCKKKGEKKKQLKKCRLFEAKYTAQRKYAVFFFLGSP